MVNIEIELNNIFLSRTGINFNKNERLKCEPLLGRKCNVPVRELLMIVVDIEEKFEVKVPEHMIISGDFKTFNRICRMIQHLLVEN